MHHSLLSLHTQPAFAAHAFLQLLELAGGNPHTAIISAGSFRSSLITSQPLLLTPVQRVQSRSRHLAHIAIAEAHPNGSSGRGCLLGFSHATSRRSVHFNYALGSNPMAKPMLGAMPAVGMFAGGPGMAGALPHGGNLYGASLPPPLQMGGRNGRTTDA